MTVQRFVSHYLSANCYLITENGHAIVIDPCEEEILGEALRGAGELDFVLLTHEHADHIFGVNWIRTAYGVPVICSEKCAMHLGNPRMNYSFYYETTKKLMRFLMEDDSSTMAPFICSADRTFSTDEQLLWQGHRILAKLTPGHSQGGASYLLDGDQLFAGDSIFKDSKTITRFKGGSDEEFQEQTLPWLRSLPTDVTVYPGHFSPFLLGEWTEWKG